MNTEPDEYRCACPDGYSGKTCEIGETQNTSYHSKRLKGPALFLPLDPSSALATSMFFTNTLEGLKGLFPFDLCPLTLVTTPGGLKGPVAF
jgi:hypothetical protein